MNKTTHKKIYLFEIDNSLMFGTRTLNIVESLAFSSAPNDIAPYLLPMAAYKNPISQRDVLIYEFGSLWRGNNIESLGRIDKGRINELSTETLRRTMLSREARTQKKRKKDENS